MHEAERHRVILAAAQTRAVATVADLVDLTGTSEATVRRDIASLHVQGRLRRVRGGAEAINPPVQPGLIGRPYSVNETINGPKKRAIARAAAALCKDSEPIIINGGTTTFQMVHFLLNRRCQVLTNSFPIAAYLLAHSKNTVIVQGGTIYREQNIILSPFSNDESDNFYAHKMFIGARGLSHKGLMEADPLIVQAELKLLSRADEIVVLVDSSKFLARSSLILCGLDRVGTVITDAGLRDEDRSMLEALGIKLIIAEPTVEETIASASVA